MPTMPSRSSPRFCSAPYNGTTAFQNGRFKAWTISGNSLMKMMKSYWTAWKCPVSDLSRSRRKANVIAAKKRHTLKALALSTSDRKIRFISELFGGHVHDSTMMKTALPPHQPWFHATRVLLDSGFQGAHQDDGPHAKINLPHKKPRQSKKNPLADLTVAQKEANRAHARRRMAVEHAFGGVKAFYCMTHRIRNHSIALVDRFLGLATGLWNFKIA